MKNQLTTPKAPEFHYYLAGAILPQQATNDAKNICCYIIAPMNNIIDNYILTFLDELRRQKFFVLTPKKQMNDAIKDLRRCVSEARLHIKSEFKEYYDEYLAQCSEKMNKDIKILYYTILQVLAKSDYPDRQILAKMEVVLTLLNLSVYCWNSNFDIIRDKSGYECRKHFQEYCPNRAADMWNEAMTAITSKVKKVINLDADPQAKFALQILQRKYARASFMKDATESALVELDDPELYELFRVDEDETGAANSSEL